MESNPATESKKRSLTTMHSQEIAWKLKSKADFIKYLDNHCKYLRPFPLTSF